MDNEPPPHFKPQHLRQPSTQTDFGSVAIPVVRSPAPPAKAPDIAAKILGTSCKIAAVSANTQPVSMLSECLGAGLVPALIEATGGRLRGVHFFKSLWQRGGASTATGTYNTDLGPVEVVVKVPVAYSEYSWSRQLAAAAGDDPHSPVPRILDGGIELGGYDLAWLICEKLNGHIVPAGPSAASAKNASAGQACVAVQSMLLSVAKMQLLAERVRPIEELDLGKGSEWQRAIASSREAVRRAQFPDSQKWHNLLKAVARRLPCLLDRWTHRGVNAWCHGDVHPGNAMQRTGVPMVYLCDAAAFSADTGLPSVPVERPPCVLIDLALIHPGHWLEDALYLERVFWGRQHLLSNINSLKCLAAYRRQLGLPCIGDYGLLANVRRVLTAAAAPGLFEREGNVHYLRHALGLIERILPAVAH